MKSDYRIDGFDISMQVILILMILLPPLALGAVVPWAGSVVFALSVALLSCWLAQGALRGHFRVARSSVWIFIAALFALALLQLVPLSPGVIKVVSPGAFQVYARTLVDYPASGQARPLSMNPYAGRMEIVRLSTLAIVFFIVANVIRTRRQAVTIILALLAIGSFEALYGFAEQFSGNKHIFWLSRKYHTAAVTGTFLNKNHFAGLLEMVLPVSIGLLLAIGQHGKRNGAVRKGGGALGRRLLAAASSSSAQKQMILAALSVALLVAIFFSLSRMGIMCAVFSLIAFVILLGAKGGFRRYTLLIFLIVAVVFSIAAGMGMELVITAVEDVVGGQSTSWIDRMDLAGSAGALIHDYPFFGTGVGAFGSVFPGYQSSRFGDAWADYLHNDWLQIFCETGFVGGALFAVGAGLFLTRLFRAIKSRKDSFCLWVATGAFLGAGVMLLHSFFDYNLSKITSNGIIFATILGLSFAVGNMPGSHANSTGRMRYWILPFSPAIARAAVVVLVVCINGLLMPFSFACARADIIFNRYLAGANLGEGPDDYVFIPLQAPADSEESGRAGDRLSGINYETERGDDLMEMAVELRPGNPKYLYYSARKALSEADELVRSEAGERARIVLGPQAGEDTEDFDQIVAALFEGLKAQMLSDRSPFLIKAERRLREAIDAAPTMARYHILLAAITGERERTSRESLRQAEVGTTFAPNKPEVLYEAGRIFYTQALRDEFAGIDTDALEMTNEYFRKAMSADPKYATYIYPLMRSVSAGHAALLSVTPQTLRGLDRLCGVLWDSGEWEGVLACLDKSERLTKLRMAGLAPADFQESEIDSIQHSFAEPVGGGAWLKGSVAYDTRSPLEIELSLAQRRSVVLGLLGRWEERARAVARYQDLLRESLGENLEEARRLRSLGRNKEAMAVYQDILRHDWGNPETLLEAAEIASLPSIFNDLPEWSAPLDHLYRLVIYSDRYAVSGKAALNSPPGDVELRPEDYERAVGIIGELALDDPAEELSADFIRGAGAVLAGHEEKGVELLRRLAARDDAVAATWRQKHLAWYFLGRGYERLDRRAEATEAYMRAVMIVPTHRPSLLRLQQLSDSSPSFASDRLLAMTPEAPCNIDFGGKITLLGYELSQEMAPTRIGGVTINEDAWFVTYYWQFNERMFHEYHPAVHFCDDSWRIMFQNDHRVRIQRKPYPVDFPRCGEVVVEKLRLKDDLAGAPYMRVSIWKPTTERSQQPLLLHDGGEGQLRISLESQPAAGDREI